MGDETNKKRTLKNSAATIGKGALHGTGVLANALCKAGKGITGSKDIRSLAAIGLTVGAAIAFSNVLIPTAVLAELGSYGVSKLVGRPYRPGHTIGMMYGAGRDLSHSATELIGDTAEAIFGLGEKVSGLVADVTKDEKDDGDRGE